MTCIHAMAWYRAGDNPYAKPMMTNFIANWVIIGSVNGLSSIRRHAIIWTKFGLMSIRPLGTNFSQILIKIQNFSYMKMNLEKASAKRRIYCSGKDEKSLRSQHIIIWITVCPLQLCIWTHRQAYMTHSFMTFSGFVTWLHIVYLW